MKPDMTLLPPDAIVAMADVMTRANTPEKHKDAKWKRMTPEEHIAAALRHIFAWLGGEKLDPELGTSHLANGSVRLSMALAREIGHSATASSDSAEESREAALEPWWHHQDEHGWTGGDAAPLQVGDRVVLKEDDSLKGVVCRIALMGGEHRTYGDVVLVVWDDTFLAPEWVPIYDLSRETSPKHPERKTLDDFTPAEWDHAAQASRDIWAETKV